MRTFQVAPPELEEVLLTHPQIIDCAVIGVKYSEDTELPRAYVVRRLGTGAGLSADDVKKWIADRLSSYKRLDGGVYVLRVSRRTRTCDRI